MADDALPLMSSVPADTEVVPVSGTTPERVKVDPVGESISNIEPLAEFVLVPLRNRNHNLLFISPFRLGLGLR